MVGGPLTRVMDAFEQGASSKADIAERTGLAPDIVEASVEHLVRLGRLEANEMAMGCPSGGCGTCFAATADGLPGCGAPGPSATREGPVLVALTLKRTPKP